MSAVTLSGVKKSFGSTAVIKGVDLEIEDGSFVVFVGPSGCGKSTLLRMIAGLETLTAGDISIGGKVVTRAEPYDRGIAMVFQSYALYPHMTVADNMGFSLMLQGVSIEDRRKAVEKAARILQIEPLLDRKPSQLSGGQRQRVAIGRAIVRQPQVFLFDEPLSNLDAELRGQTRIEIARLHESLGSTMIYVTHDQVEAMTLADKIVVLRAGMIEQVGSPTELYDNPDNRFVAGFIGNPKMNLLPGIASGVGEVKIGDLRLPLPKLKVGVATGHAVLLGVRPEHLTASKGSKVEIKADVVEQLGGASLVHGMLGGHSQVAVEVRGQRLQKGDSVVLTFDPDHLFLFDEKSGVRLR
jgi:lactose/L-arabinose transport system ATP-binding protein